MPKCDITEMNDIRQMVDSFYDKIRADNLLGEIFKGVIQDAWSEHLEKMYRFWQTVLLEKQTYFGSPFPPHAKLPVGKAHFERWLKLFNENIDEQFAGKTAEEAKWRAAKMAEMFQSKIEYFKKNPLSIL